MYILRFTNKYTDKRDKNVNNKSIWWVANRMDEDYNHEWRKNYAAAAAENK